MICDHLSDRNRVKLGAAFEKAFAFLETVGDATPDGTYELDGRNVYAMVQSYDTVPGGPERLEVHRKYIDIQYTISGVEVLAWMHDTGDIPFETPYDGTKDAGFLRVPAPAEVARLEMKPGLFAVFFPSDAHYGKIESAAAGPQHVRKVCVKVALDSFRKG